MMRDKLWLYFVFEILVNVIVKDNPYRQKEWFICKQ